MVALTVYVADDGGLNASTFSVTLNGVTQSIPLTLSASGTSGTATGMIRLAVGDNALAASISDNVGASSNAVTHVMREQASDPLQQKMAPQLSTAPQQQANLDRALCIASCFDGTLSYSTPAYTSKDVARSLTLIYRSSMASPVGIVQLDVADQSLTPAAYIGLVLRRSASDSVSFLSGSGAKELFWRGPNTRLVGLFEMKDSATGVYRYTAHVKSYWSVSDTLATDVNVAVLIVNEKDSPYGVGWNVAGLQRFLRPSNGEIILTEGEGSVRLFTLDSSSATYDYFHSPNGDFTSLRVARTGALDGLRTYSDGTVLTFRGADGRLVKSKDRLGDSTIFHYNASGALDTLTDPIGKRMILAYANGKLSSITDPGGRVSTIITDQSGQISEIRDPRGVPAFKAATYANRLLSDWADVAGGQWTLVYDGMRQLQQAILPQIAAGGQQVRLYPILRSPIWQTAILPGATNGSASPAPATSPDSVRALVIGTSGDTTRYGVNEFMQADQVDVRDPFSLARKITHVVHNAAAQPISVTTPDGGNIRYAWSGPNLDTTTEVTTGAKTSYTYEPQFNQLESVSLNGALQQEFLYSGPGRLDSTRVGSQTTWTKYTWDTSTNRLTSVRDPLGHVIAYAYEATGFKNTQSITAPSNHTTTYTHDAFGRVATVTNPLSQQVAIAYDSINRPRSTTQPGNVITSIAYLDTLRSMTVIDAKGQSYKTTVNALGWVTEHVDPRNHIEAFAYDRQGNLSEYVDRRGQTMYMTHDALGRVLTRRVLNDTTRFAYDTAGRWIAGSNAASIDTIKATANGQLDQAITVRSGRRYSVVPQYKPSGVRGGLRIVGPWGTDSLKIEHNTTLLPTWLGNFGGKGTAVGYDAHQFPNTITLPTGTSAPSALTISSTYTDSHMPLHIDLNQSAAQTAFGRWYDYDGLERLTSIYRGDDASSYTRSYSYDALARLVTWQDEHNYQTISREVICPDPDDLTTCYHPIIGQTDIVREGAFTYDSVGNRRDLGAVISTGNRLMSFNGFAMTYDSGGNMLTKQNAGLSQAFTWNGLGQLTGVITNGKQVTFYYDAFGRRIRKDAQISTSSQAVQITSYLYDGDQVLADLDSAGNAVREYSYYPGVDHPNSVRRVSDGAVFYYLTELPGHVSGLVNSSNQVVNSYEYSPFGESISSTEQVVQPYRYAAREYDAETGLYFLRSRFYDPQLARFISEDPTRLQGGINRYTYAGNSPSTSTDPYGTCPKGTFESTVWLKVFLPEISVWAEIPVPFCTQPLDTVAVPLPRIPSNSGVITIGVTGAAALGVGPSGGAGFYGTTDWDVGMYLRLGVAFGAVAGGGGEVGGSRDMETFQGGSINQCGYVGAWGGCATLDPNKGLTGGSGSYASGLEAGAYTELAHTWAIPLFNASPTRNWEAVMRSNFAVEARVWYRWANGIP